MKRDHHAILQGFHQALSIPEIVIVLAVALILLGPERMPEMVRAAGKLLRELRLASNTVMRELGDAIEEDHRPIEPPQASPGTPVEPGPERGNTDA